MGSVSLIFGHNLRSLCAHRASIAAVARDLDINKVQFNRYLTGQSFPKPAVLERICDYFDVDARILLEPLDRVAPHMASPRARVAEQPAFPTGAYRVTQISARFPDKVMRALRMVKTGDGGTHVSFCYPRAVRHEFYGRAAARYAKSTAVVQAAAQGFHAVIPEPHGLTVYFEFWRPAPNLPLPLWTGFSVYGTDEAATGTRAVRMVWEPISTDPAAILKEARRTGYAPVDSLAPFEAQLLKPGCPFQ